MKIPVFVSCPTSLNAEQDSARALILRHLARLGLEPRALGRSDYPTELPLREVKVLASHCSGGIILGFEQYRSLSGVQHPGGPNEKRQRSTYSVPTPWNQLEAGILFGLGVPLLVFREEGVAGGVFDNGVTDAFVHQMPARTDDRGRKAALAQVFNKWQAEVRHHYYAE